MYYISSDINYCKMKCDFKTITITCVSGLEKCTKTPFYKIVLQTFTVGKNLLNIDSKHILIIHILYFYNFHMMHHAIACFVITAYT